jgi:DNA-binding MarR family transcriptional regulator
MGELARLENISPPSLSGIVGRLEERGFVARSGDPADARSILVDATPAAIDALAEARRERTAFLLRGLQSLELEDRQILQRSVMLLDRIVGEE